MKTLFAAVALVFAVGVAMPPAEADGSVPRPEQERAAWKWGCLWRSSGVFTIEEVSHNYSEVWWGGIGYVLRCKERPRLQDFDVWLTVRHIIKGQRNPVLDRQRQIVRIKPSGLIRYREPDSIVWNRKTQTQILSSGSTLCYGDDRDPRAEPVRAVLFVKRRGTPGTLRVASKPLSRPVCKAPGF